MNFGYVVGSHSTNEERNDEDDIRLENVLQTNKKLRHVMKNRSIHSMDIWLKCRYHHVRNLNYVQQIWQIERLSQYLNALLQQVKYKQIVYYCESLIFKYVFSVWQTLFFEMINKILNIDKLKTLVWRHLLFLLILSFPER